MARPANHRLHCGQLEERTVPADVGCAATAEGASAVDGNGLAATGDTFAGEMADAAVGVLGAYPVRMDEDGTVASIASMERMATNEPVPAQVTVESPPVIGPAAMPFNTPDVLVVVDSRIELMRELLKEPELVHTETHATGRLLEGTPTWGVDVLLTVDSVDVVKLVAELWGEADQAA